MKMLKLKGEDKKKSFLNLNCSDGAFKFKNTHTINMCTSSTEGLMLLFVFLC